MFLKLALQNREKFRKALLTIVERNFWSVAHRIKREYLYQGAHNCYAKPNWKLFKSLQILNHILLSAVTLSSLKVSLQQAFDNVFSSHSPWKSVKSANDIAITTSEPYSRHFPVYLSNDCNIVETFQVFKSCRSWQWCQGVPQKGWFLPVVFLFTLQTCCVAYSSWHPVGFGDSF